MPSKRIFPRAHTTGLTSSSASRQRLREPQSGVTNRSCAHTAGSGSLKAIVTNMGMRDATAVAAPIAINNLKRSRSFAYSPRVEPIGYVATAIAAYFLGSVPTGFLAGKAKGHRHPRNRQRQHRRHQCHPGPGPKKIGVHRADRRCAQGIRWPAGWLPVFRGLDSRARSSRNDEPRLTSNSPSLGGILRHPRPQLTPAGSSSRAARASPPPAAPCWPSCRIVSDSSASLPFGSLFSRFSRYVSIASLRGRRRRAHLRLGDKPQLPDDRRRFRSRNPCNLQAQG